MRQETVLKTYMPGPRIGIYIKVCRSSPFVVVSNIMSSCHVPRVIRRLRFNYINVSCEVKDFVETVVGRAGLLVISYQALGLFVVPYPVHPWAGNICLVPGTE